MTMRNEMMLLDLKSRSSIQIHELAAPTQTVGGHLTSAGPRQIRPRDTNTAPGSPATLYKPAVRAVPPRSERRAACPRAARRRTSTTPVFGHGDTHVSGLTRGPPVKARSGHCAFSSGGLAPLHLAFGRPRGRNNLLGRGLPLLRARSQILRPKQDCPREGPSPSASRAPSSSPCHGRDSGLRLCLSPVRQRRTGIEPRWCQLRAARILWPLPA